MKTSFLLCALLTAIPNLATAQSFNEWRRDPLHALPDRLATGAILPGGMAPKACVANKAFGRPLALAEAVDVALCNNPQVQSAWAVIKQQASVLGEARAAYLPTVQATVSRLNTRTAYPGSSVATTSHTGNTVSAGLTWRLFDFGGRAANEAVAQQTLAAALASHDAALQTTLNGVVQAYFDAVTAQATLSARRQAAAIAQATLDSALRREKSGAAAHSDTLQAKAALAKGALATSRSQGDLGKAFASLGYAMGMPVDFPLQVADSPDARARDEAATVKALQWWLMSAMERHPSIVAARAQYEAALYRVTVARSEGLPTVDLTANRYQNGYPGQGLAPNQTQINTVGVSVTVPLFDGFARGYKVRGVQAQAEQSEAQLRETENQVLRDVVKAHADALASLHNLADSRALVDAAQESLSTSQRRYDKGAADIVELLNAQGAVADALQERVRCLSDWRSARLRLLASVGHLGLDEITP